MVVKFAWNWGNGGGRINLDTVLADSFFDITNRNPRSIQWCDDYENDDANACDGSKKVLLKVKSRI